MGGRSAPTEETPLVKPGESKVPQAAEPPLPSQWVQGSAACMQNGVGLHARSPLGGVHFLTRCGQGGNCTRWVGEG